MTAAVQNRMVKTVFECFIVFTQNASRILKSLSSLFHLFARTMGGVLRFIDDLPRYLFGTIGRVVNLLFGFVFYVAHRLPPCASLNSVARTSRPSFSTHGFQFIPDLGG